MVLAVDTDEHAARTYALNHGPATLDGAPLASPVRRWNLASVRPAQVDVGADLWWASPPCQPFTVRGRSRDVDDPRCAAFLRVLELLDAVRPPAFAMENVPGFAGSIAHARLRAVLARAGYAVAEAEWCPSALGLRNVRRRFYLSASRSGVELALPAPAPSPPLRALLDADADPSLDAPPEVLARYAGALPLVDADDPDAVTHCFTGAYGRSPVYSGSWLVDRGRVRRFSPREILRLLGFPETFRLPEDLPRQKAWGLVGNSLSVPVVRAVITR